MSQWFICDICRKLIPFKRPYAEIVTGIRMFGAEKKWEVCEDCFTKKILPLLLENEKNKDIHSDRT